jgi:uncharacterized protein
MKQIRKWSRIIHRDFGYLFFGATLVYALSGIALNHLSDWNPNYSVEVVEFETTLNLRKSKQIEENIGLLLDEIADRDEYKKHYYPSDQELKIFLSGGSSVMVDLQSGTGYAEFLRKRPLFYQVNYLHYNPQKWWTWFSDIFAGALIILAITGLVMVKGKKGITGRGAWMTALGIIVPLLFLLFS